MNKEIRTYRQNEISTIVNTLLLPRIKQCPGAIVALTGVLGAGKTSLAQALLAASGVTQTITSPTFAYVNQYENGQGDRFYHFDLYRLQDEDDFIAAGFEEYLGEGDDLPALVVIEWPQVIDELLRDERYSYRVLRCDLSYTQLDERSIEISSFAPRNRT